MKHVLVQYFRYVIVILQVKIIPIQSITKLPIRTTNKANYKIAKNAPNKTHQELPIKTLTKFSINHCSQAPNQNYQQEVPIKANNNKPLISYKSSPNQVCSWE